MNDPFMRSFELYRYIKNDTTDSLLRYVINDYIRLKDCNIESKAIEALEECRRLLYVIRTKGEVSFK